MAAPIPVYNADGTKNSEGSITKYAKIHLTIGDHSEQIDLAIPELGNKRIFLGHDWLARHNSIINWKTGGLTFACCQCRKTPFVLPDADPNNKWDEELEEGETILAIDFTQAILIRAHHANDLAAKANEGKDSKMFEEMVRTGAETSSIYSTKIISMNFPHQRRGTMRSNSLPMRAPIWTAKSTLSIATSKQSLTSS